MMELMRCVQASLLSRMKLANILDSTASEMPEKTGMKLRGRSHSAAVSRRELILSKVGNVFGGYESGFEFVEGSRADALEHYLVISARGVPRLLLPASPKLMKIAMNNFLGGRPGALLMPAAVRFAASVGGPFSSVCSKVSLISNNGQASPLRQLISGVVGRDDFHLALRLSFGRPNAKMVAMAISENGKVLCYSKLGSDTITNELVKHESRILDSYEQYNFPVIAPKKMFSGNWGENQHILITSPLELEPLRRDASNAHVAAETLASHGSDTRSTLVDSKYWMRISALARQHPKHDILPNTVAMIENIWGKCEFDFGNSHGDWTRANVGLVDGRVAALDWERFSHCAPKGIDIAHFAICEKRPYSLGKALNTDQLAEKVRSYLQSADLPEKDAEPLVLFALLEMVVRFKHSAKTEHRSSDVKFGPALLEGIDKWAA